MADLEFGGNAEERRKQAEVVIVRMHRDLYGNGTPGLVRKMETFITKHDTQEDERERQHRENQFRLNLIIALLLVISAYIAIVISVRGLPKTSALPVSGNVTATATQNAKIPNAR